MFKLSLSTSGQYISAAIFEEKLVSSSIFKSDKGSTSLLLNQIEELFKKTGIKKKDLDAVYFDNGPGYYTGLRIGLAVSQGICSSLGIPIIPVNGLDALAFAAHTSHRKICSIIDIKRNEFAYCTYNPLPGGVAKATEPEVITLDNLEIKIAGDSDKKSRPKTKRPPPRIIWFTIFVSKISVLIPNPLASIIGACSKISIFLNSKII